MIYPIRVLRRACKDVEKIIEWIAVHRKSPEGAAKWLRAYEQAVESLRHSPDRFSAAPESVELARDIRQFLFKTRRGRTYRGIFVIENDEVLILRIRGPGQPLLEPDELE